jgi:hypothetical protein
VAWAANDTDHQHLHIIACRESTSMASIYLDANSYRRKSEAIVRRFEHEFGLVAVASPTGTGRKSQTSQQTPTTSEELTMTKPTHLNPV